MAGVTETTHLTARVPSALLARLEAVARADDRSVSYEVRRAVEAHVDRLEVERNVGPVEAA